MIQANLDLGSLWQPEFYGRNLDVYLRLTHQVLPERPAVVVWPENALTFLLEDEPLYRAAIARVTGAGGASSSSPAARAPSAPRPPVYFNSLCLLVAARARSGDLRQAAPRALRRVLPLPGIDVVAARALRARARVHAGRAVAPLPTVAGAGRRHDLQRGDVPGDRRGARARRRDLSPRSGERHLAHAEVLRAAVRHRDRCAGRAAALPGARVDRGAVGDRRPARPRAPAPSSPPQPRSPARSRRHDRHRRTAASATSFAVGCAAAARSPAGARAARADGRHPRRLSTPAARPGARRPTTFVLTKQYARITPQAIAVWCRQWGHETFYAAY